MKELIVISSKKLNIKADEEYLHCKIRDEFECKISLELILDIAMCLYSKIREHKRIG